MVGVTDLDGPIVDPDHHRVVYENEHVRVLETVIPVGETTPVHTARRRILSFFERHLKPAE